MELSISNVINIQVLQPGAGLGNYNTSNLAIFSSETPNASFGALGYKIYLSPSDVETDFGSASVTYRQALAVFSQSPNILANGGYLVVVPIVGADTLAETISAAISKVQFFGIISTDILTEAEALATGAIVQAQNKIFGTVFVDAADVLADGAIDEVRKAGLTKTRCLYYGDKTDLDASVALASYFGRGLSTNFSGARTTQTMHLKDLAGVSPDTTVTETMIQAAKITGADFYISIQGVPSVFTSVANQAFDDVYNLGWFTGAIEVAGFNLYKQTPTKIPQTEQGMDLLKKVYGDVCEQGLVNEFLAAGSWTSPSTFGVLEDFKSNIEQRGYYIYSSPIAKQNAADREDRKSPLVQIAIKYAGAQHSGTVIVNVNK